MRGRLLPRAGGARRAQSLLRGLLRAVIAARAGGRGARTPLADRVRLLAYDAELELPTIGGTRRNAPLTRDRHSPLRIAEASVARSLR